MPLSVAALRPDAWPLVREGFCLAQAPAVRMTSCASSDIRIDVPPRAVRGGCVYEHDRPPGRSFLRRSPCRQSLEEPASAPDDPLFRPLLVVVEGANDFEFLMRLAGRLHRELLDVPHLPRLYRTGRLVLVPLGGGGRARPSIRAASNDRCRRSPSRCCRRTLRRAWTSRKSLPRSTTAPGTIGFLIMAPRRARHSNLRMPPGCRSCCGLKEF